MMTPLRTRQQQIKLARRRERRKQVTPDVKLHDGSQPLVLNGQASPKTFQRGPLLLVKTQGGGYRPI